MDLPSVSKQDLKTLVIILIFFVISLFATCFAWAITKGVVNEEAGRIFSNRSDVVENWTTERVNVYSLILYSLQGFLEGNNNITQSGWSSLVKKLQLEKKYPGFSSFMYIEYVPKEKMAQFIQSINAEKNPIFSNFTIHPDENKSEYYVIKYIEPIEGRQTAFGLDYGRETKRLAALTKARDTGKVTSSGKITLSTTNKSGFAMLAPVYKKQAKLNSTADRRSALQGFVAINFRDNELFAALLGKDDPFPYFDIKVYDGKDTNEDNLLYHHSPKSSIPKSSTLSSQKIIAFDGIIWTLKIEGNSLSQLPQAQRDLPKIVLFSGIFFSTLFLILLLYGLWKH